MVSFENECGYFLPAEEATRVVLMFTTVSNLFGSLHAKDHYCLLIDI